MQSGPELSRNRIAHGAHILPRGDFGARELYLEMLLDRHDKLDVIERIPIIDIPGCCFTPQNDAGIIDNIREDAVEAIKNFYQGGYPNRDDVSITLPGSSLKPYLTAAEARPGTPTRG
jgi:hypothetical protein